MCNEDPVSPLLINLSLALPEYTLSVSIFGRCTEVVDWLNRDHPFPPTESVSDWVRDAAEATASFGEEIDTALEYVHPESLNQRKAQARGRTRTRAGWRCA